MGHRNRVGRLATAHDLDPTYPPTGATQDTAAEQIIAGIIDDHGALFAVPIIWQHGTIPADDDPTWDTIGPYLATWLEAYGTNPTVLAAANPNGVDPGSRTPMLRRAEARLGRSPDAESSST